MALKDAPQAQNLSVGHQEALVQLKAMTNIIIKEADKGGMCGGPQFGPLQENVFRYHQ